MNSKQAPFCKYRIDRSLTELSYQTEITIRQSPRVKNRLEKIIDRHPGEAVELVRRWLRDGNSTK